MALLHGEKEGVDGEDEAAVGVDATSQVGLKMGRENPVPTGSVYRLNRP